MYKSEGLLHRQPIDTVHHIVHLIVHHIVHHMIAQNPLCAQLR